jgi:hypothetical protein
MLRLAVGRVGYGGLWWRLAKCRGGRRGVNKGMEI